MEADFWREQEGVAAGLGEQVAACSQAGAQDVAQGLQAGTAQGCGVCQGLGKTCNSEQNITRE